jgi:excisionase family DNA binding protein
MRRRRTNDQTQGEVDLLNLNQVAVRMGCSRRHVRRLSERGDMPQPVRLGALLRWPRESLERWVAAGCPRANEEERR